MTKNMLNLDAVPSTSTETVITLDGEEHQMTQMSVGDFIDSAKLALKITGEDPLAEFDLAVGMVTKSFPTINKKRLRSLTMDQLHAMIDFIRDVNSGDVGDGDKGEDAEGNA